MSSFEALGTAPAELAALYERGEYSQIAQLLDNLEVQARHSMQIVVLMAWRICGTAWHQSVASEAYRRLPLPVISSQPTLIKYYIVSLLPAGGDTAAAAGLAAHNPPTGAFVQL